MWILGTWSPDWVSEGCTSIGILVRSTSSSQGCFLSLVVPVFVPQSWEQLPLALPWTALDVGPSAPKVLLGSRRGTRWRDLKGRELSERPCEELQVRAVRPLQSSAGRSKQPALGCRRALLD